MKGYELELLQQAAARWREAEARTGPSLEAVVAADPDAARREQKVRRLATTASRERARALALDADKSLRARGGPSDVIRTFALERVIGTSDLRDVDFLEVGIAVARSVARVRLRSGFGTGFLVGPSLLITNNHVVASPEEGAGAIAEFDFQQNRSGQMLPVQSFRLEPDAFFFTSVPLDFTVVGVGARSDGGRGIEEYPWNRLIAERGKIDVNDPVNVIQHPRGGLKQIAFRNNNVTHILDRFLQYTTDTEPGSSGSPCFNDLWELVALHHSGVPRSDAGGNLLKKGGTVWREGVDDPALLDWIGNEGVRVSSIVEALRGARLDGRAADLRDGMFEEAPPNPVELARASEPVATEARPRGNSTIGASSGGKPMAVELGGEGATWTIPLRVTIAIGAPEPLPARAADGAARAHAAPDVASPAAAEEKVEIDPDWSARAGYASSFLEGGVDVPLPEIKPSLKKDVVLVAAEYRDPGDAAVLKYHRHSLKMSSSRRLAFYSAANVDGASETRPDLGKRKGDKWYFDPRVPRACQIGEEAYAGNALDRGHLTRREDVAWGADADSAKKANDDSFHFTNCSPQHKLFNQGKDRWQGIENFLLGKAKADQRRMIVVTGPVFGKSDPPYQNGEMERPIRIPLEFWKICVLRRPDDSISLTAFVMSQDDLIGDASALEERFEPDVYQVTLSDLAKKVPYLDFDAYPVEWDHLASGGTPGTLERAAGARRIRAPEDIAV